MYISIFATLISCIALFIIIKSTSTASTASTASNASVEDIVGITNINNCRAGSYFINGFCQKCSPGSYSATDGETSCKPCPYGTYTPDYGTIRCFSCGNAAVGSSTCI